MKIKISTCSRHRSRSRTRGLQRGRAAPVQFPIQCAHRPGKMLLCAGDVGCERDIERERDRDLDACGGDSLNHGSHCCDWLGLAGTGRRCGLGACGY
jgi:hypothetical protein